MNDPNVYEVAFMNQRFVVGKRLWRAWTGKRFLNNKEFHGPLADALTGAIFDGHRPCPCGICQGMVRPQMRLN
jgi:hypothetical protein